MKNFYEFNCIFQDGEDVVTGESNFVPGVVTHDLNSVVAFNPFMLEEYTVLRLVDGTSFVVEATYENVKSLMKAKTFYFASMN